MVGIRVRIRHSVSRMRARGYASHIPEDGGMRNGGWGWEDTQNLEIQINYLAIFVDIRVPHGRCEAHDRGHVGKVGREVELGLEEPTLVSRIGGPDDHHLPFE
jgi:hypothetical protein